MRAWELLLENDKSDFESDLDDLLIASKANGITEIDVEDLVDQLSTMGHSVTPDSLVSSLESQDNEFIKNVTLNTITLKTHVIDDETVNDYEDEEANAERIATRTAMKSVKKDRKRDRQQSKDQL